MEKAAFVEIGLQTEARVTPTSDGLSDCIM